MPPGQRRLVFRGKDLGSVVTDEQYNEIEKGTFRGLFLGDYWVKNGMAYRIADFDYWLGGDDIRLDTHHLILIPEKALYYDKMNDARTTQGGYLGSKWRTTGINRAKEEVFNGFGEEHILKHRQFLINAVDQNVPSAGIFANSTLELMTEAMLYGCNFYNAFYNIGTRLPSLHTTDKSQLALFQAYPYMMVSNRDPCWLRDIASGDSYAYLHVTETVNVAFADETLGIRPIFGLVHHNDPRYEQNHKRDY